MEMIVHFAGFDELTERANGHAAETHITIIREGKHPDSVLQDNAAEIHSLE